MKKLLLTLGLVGIFGGLVMLASASSASCRNVEFDNGIDACVNIENVGRDERRLTTDLDGGSESNLRCDLMTPDSVLRSIPLCDGEFDYDGDEPGRIKLRIRYDNKEPEDREGKPSSSSTRTYPQWVYDFDNEEWIDDTNNNDDDEDSDTSDYTITASPSDPDENEWVDVTVKAMDGSSTDTSYRGTVKFKVEKKSGSSRTTASSSLYELSTTSYRFTSSNAGRKTFTDLIRFKDDSYDYRLTVYDDDDSDIEAYKVFTFDTNNDDSDIDNFYITTDDSTPTTSQYVDLTIKARDGTTTDTTYRGTIQFEVYYKASGSYTRTKTNSSTYYTIAGDYEDDGYTFTSSNKGQKTFNNLIKFNKKNYSYKVIVYDENDEDIEGYKIFTVGTVSNDSNVDGFTDSELRTLGSIYETRPDAIKRLEDKYTRLKNSSRRQSMADKIYEEMEKVLEDDDDREYEDFMDFYNAFLDRYRYTVSVR